MTKLCWSPGPDRDHAVWRYTSQIYKIVQFHTVRFRYGPGPKSQQKHYDTKLASSISRAQRVILEKALCNKWDWFCTFTISEEKADRSDLAAFWEKFSQWLRDKRKKGFDIRYLLIPERHADGSWHAHGLMAGIPMDELISFRQMDINGYRSPEGRRLPWKIRKAGYLNWSAYQEKFGFCSLGRLKNPVAAGFYVTKYMTKDHDRMVFDVGLHTYYASRGLAVATKHVDFFGRDPWIDKLLVNKYDFCSTGMTHSRHNLDWTFCLEYLDDSVFAMMESLDFNAVSECACINSACSEADAYYDFEQLVFDTWDSKKCCKISFGRSR